MSYTYGIKYNSSTILNKNKIGFTWLQTITDKEDNFLYLYIPSSQHSVWPRIERTVMNLCLLNTWFPSSASYTQDLSF